MRAEINSWSWYIVWGPETTTIKPIDLPKHIQAHTHMHIYNRFFPTPLKKLRKMTGWTFSSFFLWFIFVENIHMMIFAVSAFPDVQRQHYSKFVKLLINLFWFCFRFCVTKETAHWSMS